MKIAPNCNGEQLAPEWFFQCNEKQQEAWLKAVNAMITALEVTSNEAWKILESTR
jgi:hypothetical protein